MRDLKYILKRSYDCSRALIIGVNKYQNASPLEYAVSDAEEIKNILIEDLGFEAENVICLTDSDATKYNILKSFLSFASENVKVDDRLLVFFAGHGHTKTGFRGEVGYLVPYDADMNDYSTFIRWDELTRNAELIRAKHILFIMDACYGGLAVNRDIQAGSSRFLKDMYQRFSRQVITAGKANEVVSDSGGPIPNHSVFTGHLIEGIRGKAANEHGVITASGLMAYVYTKVANDLNSEQTPHYGQFDGDGDFIIVAPNVDDFSEDEKKDVDELISVPYAEVVRSNFTLEDKVDYVKELLSSQKSHIKLHDFAMEEVRLFLSGTSEDNFAVKGSYSEEELLDRISSYEKYTKDLVAIFSVMAYWATESETEVLRKIISRASDRLIETQGGLTIWLNLRWYPLLLLLYHAGIAAVESKNYQALSTIFYTRLGTSGYDNREPYFAHKLSSGILELTRVDAFKQIPGHERQYTPMSEYLFKQIQPLIDNLFFLGKGYEASFDEFEILYALVVADLRLQEENHLWGPIGRFGWKYSNRGENSLFVRLATEAASLKDHWPPIKAGMFGGSYERFEKAENEFRQILGRLNWW
ncbi:caspase family protein [Salinicola sp. MIT1003]|uniref:caspase family protein n=1 Tax=Salinicola sp. MIT1003 TaxID=1882734 RepID=UPI0009145FC6|nr:caspase family protein [Salinicola sp. MIT1003]OHY99560.1 peptidase C14 caspase catalytic subunit p20 [Salinicola sp. MIT1003]